MALDYTRVTEVAAGNDCTSSQWNQLADAFNDRLTGGVGDPTYRLHWYLHSVFRGMRNKANNFVFPAEDEWWKFYSHIEPQAYDYHPAGPGVESGTNVNNPLGAFVFGNETANVYSEPFRLNYDSSTKEGIMLHDGGGNPSSDVDKWEVAKYQRGVTDSTGENLDGANALVAAQHHLSFRFGGVYHKGYGGFLPTGSTNGLCADGIVQDFTIKFRKLSPQTDCTYSSCPEGSGSGSCAGGSKGVYSWAKSAKNYVLRHWDGSITKLPISEYIEGPYTSSSDNAVLRRMDGDQLSRALNLYANEFRGNDTERALSTYFVEDYAFDFQKFFTSQYALAPAYGVDSDSDGDYEATEWVYPQFDFAQGNTGTGLHNSSSTYSIHSGFVCAGFIAIGSNLTENKTFTLTVDNVVLGSATIGPSVDNKSVWFEYPASGVVRITCDKAMTGTESAYCELAEILEMKPSNEDAYLVLRMGSANTTADDGDGHDTSTPKNISDDYFRYGMIYNATRDAIKNETNYISNNPIYQNLKKHAHDNTRMVERASLVGYAVNNGKSVLTFNRAARGVSDADIFKGIAAPTDQVQSGEIKHNHKYFIQYGTTGISYNGSNIAPYTVFTGAAGVTTFTKLNGDERVVQYDGIVETAGQNGTDNRWSMFMSTNTYYPSDSSIFKPDSYGDVIGWGIDRCAFYSQEWTDITSAKGKELLRHVAIVPQKPLLRPESPSGYRYALGTHTPTNLSGAGNLVSQSNDADCETDETESNCEGLVNHYKSCQVYVPDYQVESVINVNQTVQITLTGRLRHNSNAPSVVQNTSTSRSSYLGSETGGRTDENALVEYLAWYADGGYNCTPRIGDAAPDAPTTGTGAWTSEVFGSCHPRFYFTRQIPKVHEDGNNSYDLTDTRMVTDSLVWMDLLLRAICEGFVDVTSTNTLRNLVFNTFRQVYECDEKRLYDFTYENLFNAANSNRWPRLLPLSERSDNPKSFGPLPNVVTYAEHFNQIARAVNLLTKARLYLPVQVKHRNVYYRDQHVVTSVYGDGNTACDTGAVWMDDMTTASASTLRTDITNPGAYVTDVNNISLQATQTSRITENSTGQCVIQKDRKDVEFEFELLNLAENSLPDDLKTLVQTDKKTGFAVTLATSSKKHTQTIVANEASSWANTAGANGIASDYKNSSGQWLDWVPTTTDLAYCAVQSSGTLTADNTEQSDHVDTINGGFGEGAETSKTVEVNAIQTFVEVPLV